MSIRHRLVTLLLGSALLAPALLSAQGRSTERSPATEAAAAESRMMRERHEQAMRAAPRAQPSLEELLRAAAGAGADGGTEARSVNAGAPIPPLERFPTTTADPMERRRNLERVAPARQATREEVIESLRALPEGREMLRRLLPAERSATSGKWQAWTAALNPFRVSPLWAQNKLHIALTPCENARTNPFALLQFYGGNYAGGCLVDLYPVSTSYGQVRHIREAPSAALHLSLPRAGRYLISFSGFQTASRTELYSINSSTKLHTWDYRSVTGYSWVNYPVVVELPAGNVYLRFYNTAGMAMMRDFLLWEL